MDLQKERKFVTDKRHPIMRAPTAVVKQNDLPPEIADDDGT
jgi:hypothetical protein